jgi:hypothetical protein
MELHGLDTENEVFFYEQDFYVLVRDETERARKSVRQQVIDRVADSTRAHHELKAKVEKFEAETGIPLSGYGAPPANVIALAKRLQVLGGWSGDNPVGRLEQIAGDLDRVAEQLRKAAVDTGLRD